MLAEHSEVRLSQQPTLQRCTYECLPEDTPYMIRPWLAVKDSSKHKLPIRRLPVHRPPLEFPFYGWNFASEITRHMAS